MSIVILPELPANQWSLSEWLQKMGTSEPGGSSSFTNQDSEAVLVIQVRSNKVRDAVRQILGYSWADDSFPWLLHREYCPIQHPRYPQLWADSVTVTDEYPSVNTQFPVSGAGGITYQAKEYSVGFIGYAPEFYAKYAESYLTVRFKPNKNYRLFADYDNGWLPYTGKEWLRYFGRMGTDVSLDLITTEGAVEDSGLYWAEGTVASTPGSSGPVPGPNGTPFGGAVFVRKSKTTFHMVWRQVPMNYTCGETILTEADISSFLMPAPLRFILALGTLNLTKFPGANSPYFPGTLMFTAVKETLYQQPLRTDSEFGLFACDYEMTFEMFDPPRDPNAVKVLGTSPDPAGSPSIPVCYGDTEVVYGHNLFPNRQTRKWYLATSGTGGTAGTRGTYTGKKFYPSTEFSDMFRHVSDPDYPLPTEYPPCP